MRKWLGRILLIVLVVAIVNDVGRYAAAAYRSDDVTRNMAFAASQQAKVRPGANSGWPAAATIAQDSGVVVTGYLQTGTTVVVVTRLDVTGTWLAGPIAALLGGKPLRTPLAITRQETSKS